MSTINQAKEVTFNEILLLLQGGADLNQDGVMDVIGKLEVDAYNWTAHIMEGKKIIQSYTTVAPSIYDYNSLYTLLVNLGVANSAGGSMGTIPFEITFVDPNEGSMLASFMPTLLTIALMGVFFWLMMRNTTGANGSAMSISKSKAQMQSNLKVRFSDVAGAEEEKEELAEVVEFLKHPKKFSALGAKIPTGVLLVGPPGTGKTLFAKAVAGEAGVPFFSVSGSDFVEMYVGMGAKRVRDLFDMAKKNQPCIIFIDEIDAVGRHRGAGHGGGHDEREQTLNQILVQMDGFESNESIIVMAATNRADVLDPALLRPGRFDRQITVNLPDVKGREQILKVHARNKPMSPDVNFKTVARVTAGFSGADLANLLNEAAILAAREDKKLIENIHLFDAIDKVMMGLKKKSHVITEADRKILAYHEAGHAVLAELCKYCDPVHEVTIIPRGNGAGGFTMTRPADDSVFNSYNQMMDNICMTLGGRVAEELVVKDVTQGASGDLQMVTSIARRMITQYGMSEELGLVAYGSDHPVFMGMEYGHSAQNYSQETAAKIDAEIRRLSAEAHERATKLLTENRSILDNMARLLVEKETIYTEEVGMLMKGASYQEVMEAMDAKGDDRKKDPFAAMVKEEEPVTAKEENVSRETEEKNQDNSEEKTEE
ncbi:MAG: ATP-dependent zinc metalloprotease FtsH [Clostridia bacterium]|nr:ATP-dependent zinc metalloprotease FtsH [Clostridia bacterium]